MLSLDDYEQAIVESLAHYQGEATATILRQLALRQAAEILASGNGESVAHATL